MGKKTGNSTKTVGLAPNIDSGFYGQDIVSVRQFSRDNLAYIFGVADEMKAVVKRVGSTDLLKGHVLACVFYEPSTRTSSSFIAAMSRLGGSVVPINEVRYSSVTKGESLPDTVRTLESYADVIVLRHPEVGASKVAAEYARKPIINAGDGVGEHPTQALLDLYTVQAELGAIDGLHVAMVGDLRFGRTVHSLARLLCLYVRETYDVHDVISDVDVLYVTRVQRERFSDQSEYESVKDHYVITPELMERAKERMIVMHPLPRVSEISYAVDDDPRAAYFRQMENGMYIRMALLASVLGKA